MLPNLLRKTPVQRAAEPVGSYGRRSRGVVVDALPCLVEERLLTQAALCQSAVC